MSEYITFTYFDRDKNQEMTIKCDAAALGKSAPSHRGKSANEKHVVQQTTTVFKLTDLPNALRAHGKKYTKHAWEKAAKMQEKWFSSPAHVMKKSVKEAKSIDHPKHLVLMDYYTLDWLEKANVTGVVTNGIKRLLYGELISNWNTGPIWNKEAAHCIYNKTAKYGRKGKKDEGLYSISPRSGNPDKQAAYNALRKSYGDTKNYLMKKQDMQEFHSYFSFQTISLFETLDKAVLSFGNRVLKDEFFATVAGCTLAAAIGKYRMPGNKLIIESVYLYIRDTFDFLNDNGEDQYLGHWNNTGFDVFYSHYLSDTKNEIIDEKHEARLKQYSQMVASGYIAAPPPLFDSKPEDRFYPVRNSHFNKWRNLNRLGGDLLIFSSLKEYRCNPPIEVVLK